MSSVRLRTLLLGAALAATAGLLVNYGGSVFGADLPKTALLGAALGAVLGLVADRSPALRAGGFVIGFGAAWLGYGLRAGLLPDSGFGRGVAAVAVVSVITAVAVAAADRLPLWSGLLGAGALAGAYEVVYTATPSAFTAESTTAATTVLLSAALAFLVATVVSELTSSLDEDDVVHRSGEATLPSPRVGTDARTTNEVL